MEKYNSAYQPLTYENVKLIDQTGRRILEEVGIRISDKTLLDKLKKSKVQVDYDQQIARFEGNILDRFLGYAPTQFVLYSRDGQNDLHMGEGKVHFTSGGRVFRILDMSTGGYRLTMLRDVANAATLVNRLDYIRGYVIACQAHDVEPHSYHLNDFYHSFNHTTKHVMGGCTDLRGARQMWELASLIAGGKNKLEEKPFVSVIVNPISPLTFDAGTLAIIDFCASHGIPIICDPAPIAGATGPVTLAGNLAQMHAEALAGVILTQILVPGAKVIYGAVATNMDLRTMELTMGSVEMGMMNAAATHLAKLYNLPVYATGGVTESKRPDIQAGFEKNFSNLLVAMAGADCIHMAAGMLDSGNSISYEQYVIDNENIGMIQRILRGIKVDEGTMAFDVIKNVGPGGNYVMEEHTIEHMMDEFFYPNLTVRCNFDIWEEKGRPDMLSRSNELVQKILSEREDNNEGLLDLDLDLAIRKKMPSIQSI